MRASIITVVIVLFVVFVFLLIAPKKDFGRNPMEFKYHQCENLFGAYLCNQHAVSASTLRKEREINYCVRYRLFHFENANFLFCSLQFGNNAKSESN